MSWPESETFDEMLKRIRRKVLGQRRAQSEADKAKAERLERPPLKRSALPPQTHRFPTDEELDRMWGKL